LFTSAISKELDPYTGGKEISLIVVNVPSPLFVNKKNPSSAWENKARISGSPSWLKSSI
jgi:hypothetical protein